MSRQDKSTSERHTKTLRELVKRPENKLCADCKRNDPRWASWNLGVFLCIRCSGIHRSMGTHISKVKSVDLDIWTPEQMESIQKWGNARANLFWEAHLKPGHIPAEHKIESFIRSKYESRRWALEGPPPNDPSILENGREDYSVSPPLPSPIQQASRRQQQPTTPDRRLLYKPLSSQTQSQNGESTQVQSYHPGATAPVTLAPAAAPQDDLFSLDFHVPASSTSPVSSTGQKKDVKNDILSLFATTSAAGTGVTAGGAFGAVQRQGRTQAMRGGISTGMWGADSGWNGAQTAQHIQVSTWSQQPVQSDPSSILSQQQPLGASLGSVQSPSPQSSGFFATPNVWASSAASATSTTRLDLFSQSSSLTAPQPPKKDDAFSDLWGGFK